MAVESAGSNHVEHEGSNQMEHRVSEQLSQASSRMEHTPSDLSGHSGHRGSNLVEVFALKARRFSWRSL